MPIKKRIKLTFINWILFFKFPIILFALSFVFLDNYLTFHFNKISTFNKYSFLITFVFLILLSLYLYLLKNRNLTYKAFKISASSLAFKTACKVTAKELNGEIKKMNNSEALIQRNNFHNTECLMMLCRTEEAIYITNYSFLKSFSKKKDKKLFKIFLTNINSALNNETPEEARIIRKNKKEELFWKQKEWTFLKSLKRILIYSFLIPINLIMLWYIFLIFTKERDFKWEHFSSIIGVTTISYFYFKSDITILMEKRKRKNKK